MRALLTLFTVLLTAFATQAQSEAQQAFNEGVNLLKNNEFALAEKKFDIALKKGSVPAGLKMSWVYKGFCLNGQGEYRQAVKCFDKAIELDSLDARTYTDRGLAYAQLAENEKAISDFRTVLKLDSTGEQAEAAHYHLGNVFFKLFDFERAIHHFDALIGLVPTDAEAYFLRGTAKSNMMDIEGAIADFDFAIQHRPGYMEAYANRGVQKINRLSVDEHMKKHDCVEDACTDLLKARSMGDTAVDDMIYLHCSKCK